MGRGLSAVAFLLVAASSDTAHGGEGFFARFVASTFGTSAPRSLERALSAYEDGQFYAAIGRAEALDTAEHAVLRHEVELLIGLAGARVGLRDRAETALTAVLESDPQSSLHPIALAALLELQSALDETSAAATTAARHLADFWLEPRSSREADIKVLFLENGNLSAFADPVILELTPDRADPSPPPDNLVDRTVYLAGMALLRDGRRDAAATCLRAIMPESGYFGYARYALAQIHSAVGDTGGAVERLREVRVFADRRPEEHVLRERAALLTATIGPASGASLMLSAVSPRGPHAVQAALVGASRHETEPALALVHLDAAPLDAAEPKLAARAALFAASLHRDLGNARGAAIHLERGERLLHRYSRSLEGVDRHRLRDLRHALENLSKATARDDRERRRFLARAVRELRRSGRLDVALTRVVRRWLSPLGQREHRVVAYPRARRTFAASPARAASPIAPPDPAFPALFRTARSGPLAEWLRYSTDLERAASGDDPEELRLVLLDGRLREDGADDESRERAFALALERRRDRVGDRSRVADLRHEASKLRSRVARRIDERLVAALRAEVARVSKLRFELETGLARARAEHATEVRTSGASVRTFARK